MLTQGDFTGKVLVQIYVEDMLSSEFGHQDDCLSLWQMICMQRFIKPWPWVLKINLRSKGCTKRTGTLQWSSGFKIPWNPCMNICSKFKDHLENDVLSEMKQKTDMVEYLYLINHLSGKPIIQTDVYFQLVYRLIVSAPRPLTLGLNLNLASNPSFR